MLDAYFRNNFNFFIYSDCFCYTVEVARVGSQKGISSSAVDCRVPLSLHVGPDIYQAHSSATAVDCRGSHSVVAEGGPARLDRQGRKGTRGL